MTGLIVKTRTIPKFVKQKSWITIKHNIIINSCQKANQCLYSLTEGNVVRRSSVVWSCLFHSLDKFSCHLIALMKACVHTLLPLQWKWKFFKSDIKLYPSIFIFSVESFTVTGRFLTFQPFEFFAWYTYMSRYSVLWPVSAVLPCFVILVFLAILVSKFSLWITESAIKSG